MIEGHQWIRRVGQDLRHAQPPEECIATEADRQLLSGPATVFPRLDRASIQIEPHRTIPLIPINIGHLAVMHIINGHPKG